MSETINGGGKKAANAAGLDSCLRRNDMGFLGGKDGRRKIAAGGGESATEELRRRGIAANLRAGFAAPAFPISPLFQSCEGRINVSLTLLKSPPLLDSGFRRNEKTPDSCFRRNGKL